MRKTTGECRKCGAPFTGGWLDDGCCSVCYRRGEQAYMADMREKNDFRLKARNGFLQVLVEHGQFSELMLQMLVTGNSWS